VGMGAVRFSLGRSTTGEQLDIVIEDLATALS
jgi:cysteine sulfinate desulfinase/cysteine desulfurase-like protein